MSQAILTGLALGYPVVCHLGALSGSTWICLAWIGLLFVATALIRRQKLGWGLALGIAALILFGGPGLESAMLRLPPVLIILWLALVFGETLRPGRIPLIVAIAERARGYLTPELARYSRGLTVFWTLLFIILTIESALLGLFASDFWWSWFTNVINYAILGTVFVVEFTVRKRILSDYTHESFFDYIKIIARSGIR